MQSTTFHQLFCAALNECAMTDDALSAWTGISRERIAALKSGAATPTPGELLACVAVMCESWDAAPDEHQESVRAAHAGETALPREQVAQAIEKVFAAAKRKPVTPYTPTSELPEFLTVNEVCAYLTRSKNVVYGAIQSGQLPSRQIAGKKYHIRRADLLDYARNGVSLEKAG
jgi:excisionase family DNA binding protein